MLIYQRLQAAAALLRGELSLSHDPTDLNADLYWSNGGVDQVWGLRVSAWEAPFEMLAKIGGFSPFPDRIALGLFMSMVANIVLNVWLRYPKQIAAFLLVVVPLWQCFETIAVFRRLNSPPRA